MIRCGISILKYWICIIICLDIYYYEYYWISINKVNGILTISLDIFNSVLLYPLFRKIHLEIKERYLPNDNLND